MAALEVLVLFRMTDKVSYKFDGVGGLGVGGIVGAMGGWIFQDVYFRKFGQSNVLLE